MIIYNDLNALDWIRWRMEETLSDCEYDGFTIEKGSDSAVIKLNGYHVSGGKLAIEVNYQKNGEEHSGFIAVQDVEGSVAKEMVKEANSLAKEGSEPVEELKFDIKAFSEDFESEDTFMEECHDLSYMVIDSYRVGEMDEEAVEKLKEQIESGFEHIINFF